jgi:hypothetical protein
MAKSILTALALTLACSAFNASNCEAIQSQVEAKIRGSAVTQFTLTTVETNAPVNGRVVGTCDLGRKKIVYLQGASPSQLEAERVSPQTAQALQSPEARPSSLSARPVTLFRPAASARSRGVCS